MFDVEHNSNNCGWDYLQVGNPDTAKTSAMCGQKQSDTHYPMAYFQWTPVHSSDLTVAFYSDYVVPLGGWSMEFQCVEDLLDLPTCDISASDFGDVHYRETGSVQYSTSTANNDFSEAMDEANCPRVRPKFKIRTNI